MQPLTQTSVFHDSPFTKLWSSIIDLLKLFRNDLIIDIVLIERNSLRIDDYRTRSNLSVFLAKDLQSSDFHVFV